VLDPIIEGHKFFQNEIFSDNAPPLSTSFEYYFFLHRAVAARRQLVDFDVVADYQHLRLHYRYLYKYFPFRK
jgi:hypothetical protein